MSYELRRFSADRPPNARDISKLHADLLPDSPITLLGTFFREKCYYKDLPELGYVFGAVAYVDGQAAGFVAATHNPDGFMGAALRRRGLRIAGVIGMAVLGDPRRIRAVWEAVRIGSDRNHTGQGSAVKRGPTGELLSVGILPQFRGLRAPHIGRDLTEHVLEIFRAKGTAEVRVIVDADNLQAQRFYEKLGWRRSRTHIPGWRHASDEFVWQPEQGASAQSHSMG